jgi:RimJ/RimL family protein N-acetyltransferase
MKPYAIGNTVSLREVRLCDAQFIFDLRNDPAKNRHLSATPGDVRMQEDFIANYLKSTTDYYFIIGDGSQRPVGTIRIYDIRGDSFCWGSWILADNAPKSAAIESVLLVYDFAFFSLHYARSHFDVRKQNNRVIDFHKRFGAAVTGEDALNYYFELTRPAYIEARQRYKRYVR